MIDLFLRTLHAMGEPRHDVVGVFGIDRADESATGSADAASPGDDCRRTIEVDARAAGRSIQPPSDTSRSRMSIG